VKSSRAGRGDSWGIRRVDGEEGSEEGWGKEGEK